MDFLHKNKEKVPIKLRHQTIRFPVCMNVNVSAKNSYLKMTISKFMYDKPKLQISVRKWWSQIKHLKREQTIRYWLIILKLTQSINEEKGTLFN